MVGLNFDWAKTGKLLFIVCGLLCLSPWFSPPFALVLGIVFAQFFAHPFAAKNQKWIATLLQIAVVGLGFGINFNTALQSGKQGFVFIIASIFGTIGLGLLLGKLFKTDNKTSFLITAGTAICGGSAIAALAPVLQSKEKQTSVALGIVFILNALALFIFPVIGHYFNLSQSQFGLWCAIAIHDTSSVVGAASKYGTEALAIATTVKLTRALWIIPIALITAFAFKSSTKNIKIPYFIGFFVIAIIAGTYIPNIKIITPSIVTVAKAALTLTLFLIGTSLSKNAIKSVGFMPLLQGVLLWVVVSAVALFAICRFA